MVLDGMHYTVQVGDTLWGIAKRLCGQAERWRAIAEDNGIRFGSRILVGDQLFIRDDLVAREKARASTVGVAGPHTAQEHGSSVIPARAYTFILADEVNPLTRKVVRRVMVNPKMAAELAKKIGKSVPVVPHPERFGLLPEAPSSSTITAGRHAMNLKPSPYMSASTRPLGATRFSGQPFWVDVERARAAGATFHETHEILDDLDRIAGKTRRSADLVRLQKFKELVSADREVLVRGAVPTSAIKGVGSMALTRGLQGVQVVSFVVSAVEIADATSKSITLGSVNPIAAESVRQVGSWAAAWGGAKLGASAGALVGIETGPGAILFAAGGAVGGGFCGYLGFDWVADHLDEN
ncbi:MAG: hypothetical protein RL701_8135 [Pseudomonadota bacterium]|jgi:hypothetical protein